MVVMVREEQLMVVGGDEMLTAPQDDFEGDGGGNKMVAVMRRMTESYFNYADITS